MPTHHPRGTSRFGSSLLLLPLAIAVALAGVAFAAKPLADDPSAQTSEILPRASRSLILDVARGENAFFAVGERGHVLTSSDGRTWKQVAIPTRSTLTTVAVHGNDVWAGGHDGVILHSGDAGKTWQAQRRDPLTVGEGQDAAERDPWQGAPVMDIHFRNASDGIAVGAYSLMLVTHDGGATWTQREAVAPSAEPEPARAPMEGDIFSAEDLELEDESNPHFNGIAPAGNSTLVIVGERGTLLRSGDEGETWQKVAFPYKGSMFGVLDLGDARLLAYGLRGNAYESSDAGSSWQKVDTQVSTSLMGGSALPGGGAVLVGGNGMVLMRTSFAAPFTLVTFKNAQGETPALAGAVPLGSGGLVLVGDKGVDLFKTK